MIKEYYVKVKNGAGHSFIWNGEHYQNPEFTKPYLETKEQALDRAHSDFINQKWIVGVELKSINE